jgi:hypothetical protein
MPPGEKVGMVDTDQNGVVRDWWMAQRRAERPPAMRLLLDGMGIQLHIPNRLLAIHPKP